MKQVVIREGRAAIIEVLPPPVPDGGVLVRVTHSVISSGTERANLESSGESLLAKARRKPELVKQVVQSMVRDGLGPTLDRVRRKVEAERPAGYSCAGVVVAVGPECGGFTVGQPVACAGGGYANHAGFVAVPRNLVCPVPPGVPLPEAASVAIGAIALQGIRQAGIEIGDTVAVVGLGLVGLLSVQLARAAGAAVIAVDPQRDRRELAVRLGAAHAVPPEEFPMLAREATDGLGVDRTLLAAATASSEPLAQAMDATRQRGTVVIVGDVGLDLDRSPFYEKEIDLRISCSYGPGRHDPSYEEGGRDYPAAWVRWTENRNMRSYLELLRTGAVSWSGLEPREVEATRAAEAYADLEGENPPLVMVLAWPDAELPSGRSQVAAPGRARAVGGTPGVVRLGIIGAGEFARATHIPILRRMRDRFPVMAVATRTGLGARTAAREAGAESFTTDYRELLSRNDVDAVLIATRHDQHAALAIEALEAGKAVFLEKPVALDQAQLDAVLAAVQTANLPFVAGFNRRFSSASRFLRDLRSRHAAPPLVLYRVNAGGTGPGDWTLGAEGGGRAVGEACHMVDFLHALADAPLTGMQVSARHDGPAPDGNFSAQFSFGDGTIATLVYTTQGAAGLGKEHVEAFLGGEVGVVEDFRSGRVWRGGAAKRPVKLDKGHAAVWEAFHRACTGGPAFPIPLDQLRSVAEATFRIRDAASGAPPSNSP